MFGTLRLSFGFGFVVKGTFRTQLPLQLREETASHRVLSSLWMNTVREKLRVPVIISSLGGSGCVGELIGELEGDEETKNI